MGRRALSCIKKERKITVSKWEWTVMGTNKMDNTVIGQRNMGPTCDNCESCVYVSVHAYTHIFHASHTLHYTHTSHTHTHSHRLLHAVQL